MGEQKSINMSQFLRQYESQSTRKNYRTGLKKFFKVIYPESDEDLDILSEKYLSEERDHRDDILRFKESLEGYAPMTINTRLNAVRCFLDENGIEFPKRFFKNLNGKVKEAISAEKVPSNKELKRIIEYLPVQGKALSLVLSSSGMRVGEALQIKLSDIELSRDLVKIRIRAEYTKTGKRRITFIIPEAKESVKEWLSYRDQYVERALNRTRKELRKEKADNLFPFSPDNFMLMWHNALGKAKLLVRDKRTNRISLRPHNLRKFFRLRVGRHGVDEAEALMGHQKGLNKIYANFDDAEERLEEIYKKAIPDLSVYKRTIQEAKVSEELKSKVKLLEEQIKIVVQAGSIKDAEIRLLKNRVDRFEEHIDNVIKGKFEIFEKREAQLRKEWEEAQPTKDDLPQ